MRLIPLLPPLAALALMTLQTPSDPVELGRVHFGRQFDAALAASKASGKPVFLQFQEIPG